MEKKCKNFPAMEWLAATRDLQVMCSHIPNRDEQMVRYYGYYSNVSRGKRERGGNRRCYTLHSRTGGECEGFQKKLGKTDSKNRSLSPQRRECQGAMRILHINTPTVTPTRNTPG